MGTGGVGSGGVRGSGVLWDMCFIGSGVVFVVVESNRGERLGVVCI